MYYTIDFPRAEERPKERPSALLLLEKTWVYSNVFFFPPDLDGLLVGDSQT